MSEPTLKEITDRYEETRDEQRKPLSDLEELQTALQKIVGAPVTLHRAGEYEYCDRLNVLLDSTGHAQQPIMGYKLFYQMSVCISYTAPYGTITWHSTNDGRGWNPESIEKLNEALQAKQHEVEDFLRSHGVTLLKGAILTQEMPGHLSEMDDGPASVYQLIFTELG